jgi:hypothetical protein
VTLRVINKYAEDETNTRTQTVLMMRVGGNKMHVDLVANNVNQDAREVNTKFSKTFTTFFFPVGDEIRRIVADWVLYLRGDKLWGNDDPLFPGTQVAPGPSRHFEAAGIKRDHWSSAEPIRKIFRDAFVGAGMTYFNPHSFRNTLVRLGQQICKSPEQFKAWSQNLGHEKVWTTFINYGEVACQRQGEIIRSLAIPQQGLQTNADEFAAAMAKSLRDSGWQIPVKLNSV